MSVDTVELDGESHLSGGFDVQNRTAVEGVQPGYLQHVSIDRPQLGHGDPDRIGTVGTVQREDPPFGPSPVATGMLEQVVPPGTVKGEHHHHLPAGLQARQTLGQSGVDDNAGDSGAQRISARGLVEVVLDVADGRISDGFTKARRLLPHRSIPPAGVSG